MKYAVGSRQYTAGSKLWTHCLFLTVYYLLIYFGTALAGEFQVKMQGDWKFHPDVLTIQAGDTVVWVNEDDTNHNVLFEDTSVKGHENIKPERQFSLTFDKPGEYRYYCRFHQDYDMRGKIIVTSKP